MTNRNWYENDNVNDGHAVSLEKAGTSIKKTIPVVEALGNEEKFPSPDLYQEQASQIVIDKDDQPVDTTNDHVIVEKADLIGQETCEEIRASIDVDTSYKNGSSTNKQFTKSQRIRSCNKVMYPYLAIAGVFIVLSIFPDVMVNSLMTPEDMAELKSQSEKVVEYLPIVLKYLMYLLSGFVIYFGFKEINQGSLHIFPSYVLHKKGLMKKVKILYQDVESIDVHRGICSAFLDIGHLEISTKTKTIQINNIENPFKIKQLISKRKLNKNN
jgi:hypothetical protein